MQRNYVTIRPLNREDSVLYFPPEAFGPFRVLHQIGAGTLGPVFRAYEPGRDRLVAIKVFRFDLTPEQAAALVSELEALVAARIDHPNIAAPIAAGLEQGAAYLAHEYAIGDSLDVILRERGPMTIRDVVALVESLASAIDHAGGRGVHHGLLHMRDIVLAAGSVRISGFGIAAAVAKIGAKLPTRPAYALTNEIATAGTPADLDVYSLAAIAFEAATGKRASADNLKGFEAEHGADLRAAFGVALAAEAQSRPEHASAFAAALRSAARPEASTSTAYDPNRPIDAAVGVPAFESAMLDETTEDPLDRVIDLGTSHALELEAAPELSAEPDATRRPPILPSSRSVQPPRALQATDIDPEGPSRRWQIVAMFLSFAVLTALSVGFFLRSPRPVPMTDREAGVDSTIVDLPASEPTAPADSIAARSSHVAAADTTADKGASIAPIASSPPRSASGAVERAQTGSVLIRSTPADAEVLVDGKPRGKTPVALRDLALGSYTIRVARDGYATEERTLRLTARRPATSTTITLRPASTPRGASASARSAPAAETAGKPIRGVTTGPGGLNVQSRPAGARVFVNNRLAGSTPIAIPGLPAGSATVRIELDGYRPWTTTVGIRAAEQTRVAASLERK